MASNERFTTYNEVEIMRKLSSCLVAFSLAIVAPCSYAQDAAVVICHLSLQGTTVVFTSSNSANSPAIPNGEECAEAIADLLRGQFNLVDAKGNGSQDRYLFVRD